MKTVFKINSATEQAATQKMTVIRNVLTKFKMSHEDWSTCVFEFGCRFIEQYITNEKVQQSLLCNEKLGFWDWWIMLFIEDDEVLLNFQINGLKAYRHEKRVLLEYKEAYNHFNYFLISNGKFNANK
ncbi:MAG TPA: hypothetical protein PKE30_17555 [Niabella sp.]|nr:hypothetical protein [Niabella sp.]